MACDVLEHVIDLEKCCKELIRVLRPGGTLVVRVPHLDDMAAYLNEDLPYEFIHVRSFDLPTLRILFGKIHGLKYVEHSFVAPYFKDTLFKVKLLPLDSKIRALAKEADSPDHPLWMLRKASEVSNEEFRNWLFALKEEKPLIYQELAPEISKAWKSTSYSKARLSHATVRAIRCRRNADLVRLEDGAAQ